MKKIISTTKGTSATKLHSMIQEKKAKGEHIYNLAAGDPNLPLPMGFKGGLDYCSKNGIHNYSETQGLYELRKKIDDPERVIISNGAKQLLYMALMATCEPGDTVIIIGPCWSSYFEICNILKLKIRYAQDLILEEEFSQASAVLFNNPNNPTGKVYSSEYCKWLVNTCVKQNCWLISDEIYADLIYDDIEFLSLRNYPDVIMISGFSKNYCLTGWRFGYAIGEPEVIKEMTLIQSQISGPPNIITQESINKNWGYWIAPDKNIYKERRDLIAKDNEYLTEYLPQAGFYFYIPIIEDSISFCENCAKQYNIIMTPGDEYGKKNTIRLSFAAITLEELKKIKPILDNLFTKNPSHYYKRKNDSFYCEKTKEEIKNQIDPDNEETFLWLLKELDYPYIKNIWNNLKERYNSKNIIGKYISKMKLKSFKSYTWADSKELNELDFYK